MYTYNDAFTLRLRVNWLVNERSNLKINNYIIQETINETIGGGDTVMEYCIQPKIYI